MWRHGMLLFKGRDILRWTFFPVTWKLHGVFKLDYVILSTILNDDGFNGFSRAIGWTIHLDIYMTMESVCRDWQEVMWLRRMRM